MEGRSGLVSQWPDLLTELLLARGVGVEAGLSCSEAAALLATSGLMSHCLRILLEPPAPTLAGALHTVGALLKQLDETTEGPPRLLHGTGSSAWPLLDEAARRGYGCRIGFEDVLELPNGERAASNATLVRAARVRWPSTG